MLRSPVIGTSDSEVDSMSIKTIKGRAANGPVVEGIAFVCPTSIQGWSSIDINTGVVLEKGHVHEGDSFAGKILVVPCSRGSLGWSGYFCSCERNHVGPIGYVFTKMDSKCGTAVAATNRPCVCDFPAGTDPCKEIHDGDYIRLDGINGTVEILDRAK